MLLAPLCQKCTVADWHVGLLIICSMCYRCCTSERCSITVPWRRGPWGDRLRPRSVYNLPVLEGKGKKKKVAPSSRITFQPAEPIFQMFSPSCSLFLHSDPIWPWWKTMWCDFLFYTWHSRGRQRGRLTPHSEKVRNEEPESWKQPRKNFQAQENKTANCYAFCLSPACEAGRACVSWACSSVWKRRAPSETYSKCPAESGQWV